MSTNMDRPEAPRSSDSAPIRRVRLKALPAVASLEDRKLMTGGFGTAMGPMEMASNGPAEVAQFSRPSFNAGGPQLSFRGDFVNAGTTSSSTDSTDSTAWVNAGAAAQLGPYANLVYAAGDKLSGPFGAKAPTIASTDDSSTDSSDEASDVDTLKAAFDQLRNDTQTIQDDSEVTPKLLAALRTAQNNLVTAATGTVDSDTLTTFQDDQKTIIDSGTFTADQQATLKADYTAVLQSAGVSDDAITAYFSALDAVKTASNVTADKLTTLATDRQSLQDLLGAHSQDGVPSQDLSLPSAPGGWSQAMPGGGVGMGGFAGGGMGGFAGSYAMTGPQGGGFGSQAAPTSLQGGGTGSQVAPISAQGGGFTMTGPQGGGFTMTGPQQAPTFSLQQQQQATAAVSQQDSAVDEEATPVFTQAAAFGGQQQATPAVSQQQNGSIGGRHRTMQTRAFQTGSGGMANRMATMRFNGGGAVGRSARRG